MAYKLRIGEQSDHPESARIGDFLAMLKTGQMLAYAVTSAEEQGTDGYEAAFVRDARTRRGDVAIGLVKAGQIVGFVAGEANPHFHPMSDDWIYNRGPQVTIDVE